MNERNSQKNMRRRPNSGIAYTISDVAFTRDDDWSADYVLKAGRTLGLYRGTGQQDIEVLIDFRTGEYSHYLLQALVNKITRGERFRNGSTTEVYDEVAGETYTVEFRKSSDCYGRCLRAVVAGIEHEYQSMPADKAAQYRRYLRRNCA